VNFRRVEEILTMLVDSGHRAPEVAEALAQLAPDLREPLWAQDKQRHDHDEDQVCRLNEVADHCE
jgi:hypothetical protein